MPTQHFRLTFGRGRDAVRLDALVADWLREASRRDLSKSAIRRLVVAGVILVNGRPVRRPAALVRSGDRLEARVDVERLSAARVGEVSAAAAEPAVLFRDRWLLAVSKPPGLQVHASADRGRPDLFSIVRRGLARETADAAGAEPYLALHQRLDVGTSGVVLFAIDRDANDGLARAFERHEVEKIYDALTVRPARRVPVTWVASGPLGSAGRGRSARVVVLDDGQPAETRFEVRQRFGSALLVEARPCTGRKHQIRAHLADAGLPILGDLRYGGPARIGRLAIPRVMLHAAVLRLAHPITGAPLEIRAPHAPDVARVLRALAGSLDSPGASR